MARERSEAKIQALMAAGELRTQFFANLGRAAKAVGASELDMYRLLNGTGQLSYEQLVRLSMRPHKIEPVLDVTPPPGGKCVVVDAIFDYTTPSWRKMIGLAAPQTPIGNWLSATNVRNVCFQTGGSSSRWRTRVVLANFGPAHTNVVAAGQWGEQNGLVAAAPMACIAVGQYCPLLNKDLGLKSLALISLEPKIVKNTPQYLVIVWDGDKRWAFVQEGMLNTVDSSAWVPFLKKQ